LFAVICGSNTCSAQYYIHESNVVARKAS